jgi:hypothetical protein
VKYKTLREIFDKNALTLILMGFMWGFIGGVVFMVVAMMLSGNACDEPLKVTEVTFSQLASGGEIHATTNTGDVLAVEESSTVTDDGAIRVGKVELYIAEKVTSTEPWEARVYLSGIYLCEGRMETRVQGQLVQIIVSCK